MFYTTGRLTSEMVIKCAQMRIPFLVSRSGLTQMGHAIAKQGRHHHARPRERPALPRVYRQGKTRQDGAAADGAGVNLELYFAPGACSFVPHAGLEAIKAATGQDFTPKLVKLHKGEQQHAANTCR